MCIRDRVYTAQDGQVDQSQGLRVVEFRFTIPAVVGLDRPMVDMMTSIRQLVPMCAGVLCTPLLEHNFEGGQWGAFDLGSHDDREVRLIACILEWHADLLLRNPHIELGECPVILSLVKRMDEACRLNMRLMVTQEVAVVQACVDRSLSLSLIHI